ncbi:hypothetical protein [Olivibacter sitiensis]|uniref:hypothetical protein n=1 Tax=Olivibacter sitiensis TaxID=376470 RepID=UPI000423B96C|nr:hypothetical protein [Olivibacter sitiensis]
MEQLQIDIKKHSIVLLFSLMMVGYFIFPPVVRMVDITSAPIDPGILSAILLAAISVCSFILLSLWLLHRHWPVLGEYASEHLERNFKSLLSWQKVVIYFALFVLLLYAFVAALAALL